MKMRDEVPEDYKRIALALLSDEQLQGVLADPRVASRHKADVRAEIARRAAK